LIFLEQISRLRAFYDAIKIDALVGELFEQDLLSLSPLSEIFQQSVDRRFGNPRVAGTEPISLAGTALIISRGSMKMNPC